MLDDGDRDVEDVWDDEQATFPRTRISSTRRASALKCVSAIALDQASPGGVVEDDDRCVSTGCKNCEDETNEMGRR